jgi:enoyl-[acyl-carrier protein] reductase II
MAKEYIKREKEGASMMELEKFTLGGLRRAVVEGDVDTGSLMAGQVAGMINKEDTLANIIENLFKELKEEQKKIAEVNL